MAGPIEPGIDENCISLAAVIELQRGSSAEAGEFAMRRATRRNQD